ncbi:hypothetical protein GOP47_0004102 [Adiantum capillus-veneris]|uniref:Uncharacterized protein n=1 Tax=Adiantum capillus-veneris TaxID=13818 RepID=A0A9D4ZMJ4_ADICA|nr:hypothetical protein GOP47_0004102 [Adiantum capillus-veneris]
MPQPRSSTFLIELSNSVATSPSQEAPTLSRQTLAPAKKLQCPISFVCCSYFSAFSSPHQGNSKPVPKKATTPNNTAKLSPKKAAPKSPGRLGARPPASSSPARPLTSWHARPQRNSHVPKKQ